MSDNGEGAYEKRHWVRLTRYCNQRCIFCLDRFAQTGGVVPLASLRRSLLTGLKQGLRRVVLSGGEATIHPEFIEIVELARELGYTHIQTITNGRRFCYPDFLKRAVAAGLKEVTFSLHGNTPALHDRLTQVPGSFVQALSGLRAAVATPGLIVSVDVVINKLNLPVLREHLDFCIGLGVGEFDLLALVPFGDAWKNRSELHCDFSRPENLARLHRALELSRRPDLHIWTNRLRPEHLEDFESLIQPPAKILDEVRGRRRIFARYLNAGRYPSCSGDACRHCFLRDFCSDLALCVKDGRLPAKVGPLCLRPEGKAEPFRFGKKPDIFSFARFYIESRYFLKASQCRGCALEARCGGMSVREIREKGFAAMIPVPKGLRAFRRIAILLIAVVCAAGTSWAATLGEADAAYKNGRYEQVLESFFSAATKGDPLAQYRLGEMYSFGRGVRQDSSKAIVWYNKAAAQGDIDAQNNLGVMYYDRRDYGKALKWFLGAARAGKTEAQFNAGNIYYNGDGVTRDYAKAARWYHKAGGRGDARAQNNLGFMYAGGQGVAKDEASAFFWYRKAAEQGSMDAQAALGFLCESGGGVPQDHVEAYKWYLLASAQGHEKARRSMETLGSRMSGRQISEAKERASRVPPRRH
ncbi:MAG TPA: hypothetical protein DCZ01_06690 [Elusimicrobia bacterium]|nr:MAG: hypothetical protein A2X37_05085 [Elusimicrobia bacterium GWA2_66_18]OGR76926.1 MAG: hypothetical protein A2X40_04030 [Elusimicrobia bacterium GWC2_65_9]HAZ08197.1 hypothetical protein [Elusimicrobiota bacterium]